MSLQDKINSAKPTTFLTDGLSEEEVKQAVDKGRKRKRSHSARFRTSDGTVVYADSQNVLEILDNIGKAESEGKK